MALDPALQDINQKTLVDALLAPVTGLINASMHQFAIGIEDSRNSQRRMNAAADAAMAAQLGDYRIVAMAQSSVLTGANAARQDSLATTEIQQAVADAAEATSGAMADQTRLQSTLAEQLARFDAVYTNLGGLVVSLQGIAEAIAKIAGSTPPITINNNETQPPKP